MSDKRPTLTTRRGGRTRARESYFVGTAVKDESAFVTFSTARINIHSARTTIRCAAARVRPGGTSEVKTALASASTASTALEQACTTHIYMWPRQPREPTREVEA